jgi:acetoin utilization deacetylase AcuC-like enzyme
VDGPFDDAWTPISTSEREVDDARSRRVSVRLPVVWSDRHEMHDTGRLPVEGYPFRLSELPQRVERILTAVRDLPQAETLAPADAGLEPILAVHDEAYVEFLRTHRPVDGDPVSSPSPSFPNSFPTRPVSRLPVHPIARMGWYAFDIWAPVLDGTWEAAYWSAQCAVTAAGLVAAGAPLAYALCRPPGHHAGPDYCGGLCYLNNTAVAARRLTAAGRRVAILDIDYHHGNGTQHVFYADPAVLVCSLHADPDQEYPYFWGHADETGEGDAAGANRNWPLPHGTSYREYRTALGEALTAIEEWGCDALVAAAGFDTAGGDPLGLFRLRREDFADMGALVSALGLSTVVVQEGGYDLDRIGGDVAAFLAPLVSRAG